MTVASATPGSPVSCVPLPLRSSKIRPLTLLPLACCVAVAVGVDVAVWMDVAVGVDVCVAVGV